MMPFIPILLVLASLTLLFTRRRYKAIESAKESPPRVIVKGHTYSDSVESTPSQSQQRNTKVENVRKACIIGAGRVGALTGIVLASQNPEVEFFVVDSDTRIIEAWKSDHLPVLEPGLDAMVFEDETPRQTSTEETNDRTEMTQIPPKQRQRKLLNLTFSINIHAGIAAADMIFLCIETPSALFDDETTTPDLSALDSAIQSISHASSGHKIIVQKTTAPCGIVEEIKKRLKATASPSATFDVLSNPEFILPGSALQDLLHPPRIIIGHMYTTDMSPTALTALKRLYTPFVLEERIITMDAWSSELGKIAANALIAQQISSLNSLAAVCEYTGADMRHVVEMAGPVEMARHGRVWSMNEVRCLVYLARELGLGPIAEYWRGVLSMEGFHRRRVARRVLACLEGDLESKKVAVCGVGGKGGLELDRGMGLDVVRELVRAGVQVTVYDSHASREQVEGALRLVDCVGARVAVVESLEEACLGCSAVVLDSDGEYSHDQTLWQAIAGKMEPPRVFLDTGGVVERFKMQQLEFDVLQLGVRAVERK